MCQIRAAAPGIPERDGPPHALCGGVTGMKHAQILFGLALATACLAVGSVGWVFGQPDPIVNVPPPPTPVMHVAQGPEPRVRPQVPPPVPPPAPAGSDGAAQHIHAQGVTPQQIVSPPAQPAPLPGQPIVPGPQQPPAFPSQPILLENQLP